MRTNRRQFVLGGTAAILSGLTIRSRANICGTNEDLRVAAIGFGGRGRELINAVRAQSNARLVALCDADGGILNKFEPDNKELFRTQNCRALLERKDVDAIVSATPNHWHTLIAMLACQAGKHVYIEKPISHNMYESQQVVAASRTFDRIVQCGFQNRSDVAIRPFFQRLNSGDFGKVLHVHGTCHRPRDPIGKLEKPLVIPKNIDYDLWLGPAADQPILRPRLHYDWHWDYNTGNGDVGNQGPHEWDLMNWALGDSPNLPTKMVACGNRFGWNDAGNTPNVMACFGDMGGIPFCFEVMDLKDTVAAPHHVGVGVIITTEKGTFAGGRGGGKFTYADGKVEDFKPDASQTGRDGLIEHVKNFIDAIQTHDRSKQHSECAVAAKSSAMAHMANISYRLGVEMSVNDLLPTYAKEAQGAEVLERLARAPVMFASKAGVANRQETWKAGPTLTFNNVSKQFEGDHAASANSAMTRDYRKGFELPKV